MSNRSISLPNATPLPGYQQWPAELRRSGEYIQALYIHIPFCTYKCDYCDFYSLAGHQNEFGNYLDALERQMEIELAFFGPVAPDTIFIGGGTPTLLPPDQLQRLMAAVSRHCDTTRLVEYTVESNPNTFDVDLAAVLARAGVNRLSFGAQSFQPDELVTLNRDHDPQSVGRALKLARQAGITNLNIDLIYAIPGQTVESLAENLKQAVDLGPTHLSCYGLMYEPNTPMTARALRGLVKRVDEELELAMMHLVAERLQAAGFHRYEISNWAKPGLACRHNLHYWHADDHLAWGVSASGHSGGTRWKYVSSLHRYVDALRMGLLPLVEMEHLPESSRWAERAVLQLRLAEGIDLAGFEQRSGMGVAAKLGGIITKYQNHGMLDLIAAEQGRMALTDAGIAVSDTIFADVFAAISAS
jgi:putative oxygen-independent coproporphyrinogen III oxidase